jgi:hypothetical protein
MFALDSSAASTRPATAASKKARWLRAIAVRSATNGVGRTSDDASTLDRRSGPHPGGAKSAV